MKVRITVHDENMNGRTIKLADLSTMVFAEMTPTEIIGWATDSIATLAYVAVEQEYVDTEEDDAPEPVFYKARLTAVGNNVGSVWAALTQMGLDDHVSEITSTVNSGGTFVLKEDLTADEAVRLKDTFSAIGATIEIV